MGDHSEDIHKIENNQNIEINNLEKINENNQIDEMKEINKIEENIQNPSD